MQGHVLDPQGRAVEGAAVAATNSASGAQFRAQSDPAGAYRFPLLAVGEYRITATHPQFRAAQARAVVVGAQAVEVDLRFVELAARRELVTVRAEPLAVDTTSAGVQAGYTAAQVLETPGASESLLALVTRTGTAWHSQEHLHIRGAHQVAYRVNGVEIPDLSLFGAVTPLIDPRNVNFAEVTTGGLLPEYGNRTAGVVDAVVRSGLDEGARRGQIELAGGNLKRASAFAAYGGRAGRGGAPAASGERVLGYYLQAGALARGRGFNPPPDVIAPGAILQPPEDQTRHNFRRTYQGFGNFDYRQGSSAFWNLTLGSYRTGLQIPNTQEQQRFGRDYLQLERDRFLNLQWNRLLSGGGLLTLTGFFHQNRVEVAGRRDAPGLPLAGDNRRAGYAGGRADFSQRFSRGAGGHFFKTGLEVYRARVRDDFLIRGGSSYASRVPSHGAEQSFYAQDQWMATGRLTLTYGARLDRFQASYFPANQGGGLTRDYSFLSPRLGFAYRLGDSQTVLFGNAAYLFLPPPLEYFDLPQNGLFPERVSFTPTRPEQDAQYDVGLKFQLRGFRIRADQWFKRQMRFLDHVQLAPIQSGLTSFGGAERINPNIFLPVNLDRARAYGAELLLESPQHRGFSLFLNYAYNRAQAYGGIIAGLRDGREFEPRYFSLDHDQRHAGYAGVTWRHEPTRTFVTTLYGYGSGFPDASAELLAPFFAGEPTCARRNCRLPPHHTLSFSLGKSLGDWLTLRLEVENVTNAVYPINLGSEFNGSHFSTPRQAAIRLTYRF